MIPVIVLTVSQTSSDILQSRRLGAESYIVKPVDFYNFSQVTPDLQMQWALFKPAPGNRSMAAGAAPPAGDRRLFLERSAPTFPY